MFEDRKAEDTTLRAEIGRLNGICEDLSSGKLTSLRPLAQEVFGERPSSNADVLGTQYAEKLTANCHECFNAVVSAVREYAVSLMLLDIHELHTYKQVGLPLSEIEGMPITDLPEPVQETLADIFKRRQMTLDQSQIFEKLINEYGNELLQAGEFTPATFMARIHAATCPDFNDDMSPAELREQDVLNIDNYTAACNKLAKGALEQSRLGLAHFGARVHFAKMAGDNYGERAAVMTKTSDLINRAAYLTGHSGGRLRAFSRNLPASQSQLN